MEFLEKASRPGVLGAKGRALEKRLAGELASYFAGLKKPIEDMSFESLTAHYEPGLTKAQKGQIRHGVQSKLSNILRKHRPLLLAALAQNLKAGYEAGYKHDHRPKRLHEADPRDEQQGGLDILGQLGQDAADWAAEHAAKLVTGLENTTIDGIAQAVSDGIESRAGVPGTASLIKDAVDGMSTTRALLIAATEMNDAMSQAAMDSFDDQGIEYKQIILSPGACPICEENADADPLPVDELYPSGDDAPPFHPNCRCAITGAYGPGGGYADSAD